MNKVTRYDEQVFAEFPELPTQHVSYLIEYHDNHEPGAGRGWLGYGNCSGRKACQAALQEYRESDRTHLWRAVEHRITTTVLDW